MDSLWKEAFDAVQATEQQKERAMRAVKASAGQAAPKRRLALRTVPALLLAAVIVIGCVLFFTPTIAVAVEGESTVTLSINPFDRVIASDGGGDLYISCEDAVERLLAQADGAGITIIGGGERQRSRLGESLRDCGAPCDTATEQEAKDAAAAGLSVGKYRAYLAWHELDASVTAEDAACLSMRQIREKIAALQGEEPSGETESTQSNSGGAGKGGAKGNGKQYGKKS